MSATVSFTEAGPLHPEIVVELIIEMICDVYILLPNRLTEVDYTCRPGTGGAHLCLLPRRKA